jgi:hypothetical protein
VYDTPLTIEQILTILAATPPRLAKITKDLSPAQLVTPPEPGEWSARDCLSAGGHDLSKVVQVRRQGGVGSEG